MTKKTPISYVGCYVEDGAIGREENIYVL